MCSFDLSLRLLYDPRASLLRREYAMLRDIWYTEPICQNVFGEWYLKYLLQSKDWNQIKQSWFRKKHWIGTNGNILEQIYLIRENVTKTQNYKFNVCNTSSLFLSIKNTLKVYRFVKRNNILKKKPHSFIYQIATKTYVEIIIFKIWNVRLTD